MLGLIFKNVFLLLAFTLVSSTALNSRAEMKKRLERFHGIYTSRVKVIPTGVVKTHDAIKSVDTEIQSLLEMVVNELNSQDDSIGKLQKENSDSKKVNGELKDGIQVLIDKILVLQRSNGDLTGKVKSLEAEKKGLTETNARQAETIARMKGEQQSCQNTVAELNAEIEKLKLECKDPGPGPNPPGYVLVNGRYVKLHDYVAGWSEAYDICSQEHGQLITAEDQETQQWIKDRYVPMWIGANDRTNEGFWTWADGSSVYNSNWNAGEPNNAGGKWEEDCAAANIQHPKLWWFKIGKWTDVHCDVPLQFACEIPNRVI